MRKTGNPLFLEKSLAGCPCKTLLIQGDAGSGKTGLKDALVRELPPDVAVIQSNCFKPEQNIPLRPWTGIVEGLDNLVRREKIKIPNVSTRCIRSWKMQPR